MMSVKEFADYMGISCMTVYGLVRQNEIPHYRVGKRILLNPADFKQGGENDRAE